MELAQSSSVSSATEGAHIAAKLTSKLFGMQADIPLQEKRKKKNVCVCVYNRDMILTGTDKEFFSQEVWILGIKKSEEFKNLIEKKSKDW